MRLQITADRFKVGITNWQRYPGRWKGRLRSEQSGVRIQESEFRIRDLRFVEMLVVSRATKSRRSSGNSSATPLVWVRCHLPDSAEFLFAPLILFQLSISMRMEDLPQFLRRISTSLLCPALNRRPAQLKLWWVAVRTSNKTERSSQKHCHNGLFVLGVTRCPESCGPWFAAGWLAVYIWEGVFGVLLIFPEYI